MKTDKLSFDEIFKIVSNIHNGSIGHCYRNKPLSIIIRLLTWSKYNHSCLFEVCEKTGEIYVWDAQKDGFTRKKLEDWIKKYGYKFIISTNSTKVGDESVKNAYKYNGLPYAKKDLVFKHFWQSLTGGWRYRGVVIENQKVVCSEIVARCRGFEQAYRFTPKMLKNKCVIENESFFNPFNQTK